MEAKFIGDGRVQVTLNENERVPLNNALNEVCNGLEFPEFQIRMGPIMADAEALLEKIHTMKTPSYGRAELELKIEQIALMGDALNEVCNAFDPDFHPRIGCHKWEAAAILEQLRGIAGGDA